MFVCALNNCQWVACFNLSFKKVIRNSSDSRSLQIHYDDSLFSTSYSDFIMRINYKSSHINMYDAYVTTIISKCDFIYLKLSYLSLPLGIDIWRRHHTYSTFHWSNTRCYLCNQRHNRHQVACDRFPELLKCKM